MIDLIQKYFTLEEGQAERFERLGELYPEWNSKINVISRKDIDNLYEHHILHSLAIAKTIRFKDSTTLLDAGTGGGFPGIPLAILFPNCHFLLVDSVGKKVLVASQISQSLGLSNVECRQARLEEVTEKVDFVVSRAVMPLPELVKLARKNISKQQHNALPNGLICLKGGELQEELKPFHKLAEVTEISRYFSEEYFKTKKVVYLPL